MNIYGTCTSRSDFCFNAMILASTDSIWKHLSNPYSQPLKPGTRECHKYVIRSGQYLRFEDNIFKINIPSTLGATQSREA